MYPPILEAGGGRGGVVTMCTLEICYGSKCMAVTLPLNQRSDYRKTPLFPPKRQLMNNIERNPLKYFCEHVIFMVSRLNLGIWLKQTYWWESTLLIYLPWYVTHYILKRYTWPQIKACLFSCQLCLLTQGVKTWLETSPLMIGTIQHTPSKILSEKYLYEACRPKGYDSLKM